MIMLDKKQIITFTIIFLIGCIVGYYVSNTYFPNNIKGEPIVVTKEILSDPIKLTQVIHEPYAVTNEIVREIEVAKPSQTAIRDADKVLIENPMQTTTDVKGNAVNVTNQYNIVLDRKFSVGAMATNHGPAVTVGVNPNKNTAVNVIYGSDIKGVGIAVRF